MPAPRRVLHPELSPGDRLALLQRGIELFAAGAYFDAHEAFEEIWRSTTPEPRDLFQGLAQVTAALFHFHVRGRAEPARRILARSRRRLEALPATSMGLDLATLLAGVGAWEAWLIDHEGAPPPAPLLRVCDADALR